MYLWSKDPGPSAESNGDATFEFFDDFPLGPIDTNKWTLTNPTGWSIIMGTGTA